MTTTSNEADGDHAVQPRLSFEANHPPESGGRPPSRPGLWVACVPIFVLLVIVATVQTAPEVHEAPPPPPLQTFTRPPVGLSPPQFVRPRATVPEPIIRVNVTPGGVDSFQLEVRGEFECTSMESNKAKPDKFEPGTVKVSSTRTGLKIGSHQYATSQLEIAPDSSPAIRVNGHLYRGRMRLFRRTDGKVSAVNVLPIEEYLASVVDSEMPAKFPEAARQAQAIVARTYALYQIEHAEPKAMFDVLSSQQSQKYVGVEYTDNSGRRLAGESESSRRIVKGTRGTVCHRHRKLFCAYYSAVCGGQTTEGKSVFKDATDIVRSVPCDWCRDSPHYRWTTELTREEFQKRAFNRNERELKKTTLRSIRQQSGPGDGSISRFEIDDGQQSVSISGIELRERLPGGILSSPHFRINLEKDRVVFEGRGHGHGVGFCQWGAKGQAEAGRNCDEIIHHYYPGAEITLVNY